MSEWTELVWTGINLILAAVILGIVFSFVGLGKNLQTQMYEDQAVVAKLNELRTISAYDGTILSGSEVAAAMLELTGSGIPTVCLIRNTLEYTWGKSACCGIITYNESSDVDKARDVFTDEYVDSAIKSAVAFSFQSDTPYNKNLLQRVSNKHFTTAAFVANVDSFFSSTTFSDWKFKSEAVVENGVLVGVHFRRITYRTEAACTIDNWADELPKADTTHIREWVVA